MRGSKRIALPFWTEVPRGQEWMRRRTIHWLDGWVSEYFASESLPPLSARTWPVWRFHSTFASLSPGR